VVGLTAHIKDVTDRLAAEGFVALAPDLFGGATTHDSDEAGTLMQELPVEQASRDLAGAVDFLLGHEAVTSSKVGAIGFCMGGGFVLVLAAQQGDRIGAAVPFHGVLTEDYPGFENLTSPLMGHFGEQDDFTTPDAVRELAARIEKEVVGDATVLLLPGRPRVLQRREPAGHPRPGAGGPGVGADRGVPARAPGLIPDARAADPSRRTALSSEPIRRKCRWSDSWRCC
jgi:dienelactone hydrolase